MHDLMSVFAMMDEGKNEAALEIVLQRLAELDPKSSDYMAWLNALGYIDCNLSAYDKAVEVYNQYIALARQNSDAENLHIGFHQKAMALRLNGQYAEALEYIHQEKKVIAAYFKDDCLKLSVNEYEYGYLLYLMEKMEDATRHMELCLDHALKTEDLVAQACAYRGLAEIFSKGSRPKQADAYFDKAYALFMDAGDPVGAEEVRRMQENNPA